MKVQLGTPKFTEICPHLKECDAICSAKLEPSKRKSVDFVQLYQDNHVDAHPTETGGIMVVGLYPGWKEVEDQENAIGVSGTMLRKMFVKAIRYLREITKEIKPTTQDPYIFYTNIIRCRPRKNIDDKTLESAMHLCSMYTEREIQQMQPTVIMTGGELPAKYFLKKKFSTLKKQRALYNKENYSHNSIPVFCTWNAARCVRAEKISAGINAETQIKNDIIEIVRRWNHEENSDKEATRIVPVADIL